jgi:chromosomal replication initiator protein
MLEAKLEVCNPCVEHPSYFKINPISKRLNSNEILESISKFFEIPVTEIVGKKRTAKIAEARMVAAYVLRKDRYLSLGLKHIGNILGGKDHTSVMHQVKRIGELIDIEPEFRVKIKEVFLETYGSATYFYE